VSKAKGFIVDYADEVVILVDETSQSQAEYTAMVADDRRSALASPARGFPCCEHLKDVVRVERTCLTARHLSTL